MFLSLDISPSTAIRSRIRPFLLEGRANIPALASTTPILVAETKVLPNYNCYILAYGVTVRDPNYDYTGTLEFSLYINGAAYLDNNSKATWTLQRGSVVDPIPTLIQTQSGGLIQFFCRRAINAAQAQPVDFIAHGWQIPSQTEPTRNCFGS